jgi:hypothetical protein
MARQAHASARNDSCSLRRPVEQQLNSSKVSILSGHFDCSHTFIFRLLTLQSILVTIGRCAPAGLNYATRSKRCLCAGSRGSDGSAASHLSGFVSGGSVQESHSGQQGVCCSSHFDSRCCFGCKGVALIQTCFQQLPALPGITVTDAGAAPSPQTPHSEEEMSRSEVSARIPCLHFHFTILWMFSWSARSKCWRALLSRARAMQRALLSLNEMAFNTWGRIVAMRDAAADFWFLTAGILQ